MPRDGSNVYHYPAGIEGFPDTPIQSAPYNSFLADVEQDLNAARPILAGGTGATSADAALAALGGEKAGQIVTNYDSFVFTAGSFSSAIGATNAPEEGQAFVGTCYMADAGNFFIEARSLANGNLYARGKVAGVWSVWVNSDAVLDAAKVNRAGGDTMTGGLTVNVAAYTTAIRLQNSATGLSKQIRMGGASDLEIVNSDNNAVIMTLKDSGDLITGGAVGSGGDMTVKGGSPSGTLYFGNTGTKYFQYDGTNFNISGGVVGVPALYSNGRVTGTTSGADAQFRLQDVTSGTSKYLRNNNNNFEVINNAFSAAIMTLTDAGNLTFNGGQCNGSLTTSGSFAASGNCSAANFQLVGGGIMSAASIELGAPTYSGSAFIDFHSAGGSTDFDARIIQSTGGQLQLTGVDVLVSSGLLAAGHRCKPGLAAGYGSNWFNIMHGTGQQLWIDNTSMGTISVSSDYRIKKGVVDLPGVWETVKKLRPVKYTQAEFSPPSHVEYVAGELAKAKKREEAKVASLEVNTAPLFEADDIERWGFIAHELQETLIPSAASGVKDAPNEIQSLNWGPLVAVLTKALQEAMARIEALEAR